MHPSKRTHNNRTGKKPAQSHKSSGPQKKRHQRPAYSHRHYDEPVSQAELDASIEYVEQQEAIIRLPAQHKVLLDQHYELKKQIKVINDRLTFGFSEPLEDYRNDLLKQDFKILAEITDVLLSLKQ